MQFTKSVDVKLASPLGFLFIPMRNPILWPWVWIEMALETVQEPIVGVRLELNICANQVHWTLTPPGSDQDNLNVFLHWCSSVKLLRFFIFHDSRKLCRDWALAIYPTVNIGYRTVHCTMYIPVLWIQYVYSWSQILIIIHPGSRIPDPGSQIGSRIPDPTTASKEERGKNKVY